MDRASGKLLLMAYFHCMKHLVASLLILCSFSGFCQSSMNTGFLGQYLDVTDLRGMKFKIQAAVRVDALEPSAEAEIWVRVDRQDKPMVYYYNMKESPIRKKEWAVYSTPEVLMDKQAKRLYFGGWTQHRGIFYFDDFHLLVQKKDGDSWEDLPLQDGGFESDTAILNKAWGTMHTTSSVIWSLDETSVWEGKRAYRADGSRSYAYDDNDTAGRYAEVNGIRLYYEEYGKGTPLLLLHGNRGSIADFKQQIPSLSKQFHVIAVDSRGQGHSTEDGKTFTYDLFAEDMHALLDHLHLSGVNVLGWSDGGNIGLIMAMRYPDKVSRLATMGANIFIDERVVDKSIFRLLNEQKKEFRKDTSQLAVKGLRFIHLLETEPRHSYEDLQAIHCPVLVMAGEKDVIREEHTRQIAAHIPGSQLMIFQGGTHHFPEENPAEFNRTVIQFFNGATDLK